MLSTLLGTQEFEVKHFFVSLVIIFVASDRKLAFNVSNTSPEQQISAKQFLA
jgi:hypothetical protein